MHKPPTLKNLVSSGGVLFRKSDEVFEVALVSIRGSRVWSLPKGIIERDEVFKVALVSIRGSRVWSPP